MVIEGAVAAVTGASSGLGRAVALRLAQAGARIGLFGRDPGRLQSVLDECRSHGGDAVALSGDIADEPYVRGAFEQLEQAFGPVDIVVNCAGVSLPAKIRVEDVAPDTWDEMFQTNVRGTYLTCHHILPRMKQRGQGVIVNIGSTGAHVALPGVSAYAASKFAVRALTEAMAQECDGTGVRACLVSSGPIDTPIWDKRSAPTPQSQRDAMLRPDDIVDAVVWLIERPQFVRVDEILLRPARRTPIELA